MPLQVGREKSVDALNAAVATGGPIALVTQRQAEQEDIDDPAELYDGRHAGQDRPGRPAPGRHRPGHRPGPGPPARARLRRRPSPYIVATIEELADETPAGVEVQALMRTVQAQIEQYVANGAPVPPEAAVAARNITRARACWPTWSPTARTCPPSSARSCSRRSTSSSASSSSRNFLAPPDRDPRAEGQDPVRSQVRDGQDPARVHPARAAQGHPARARRGRPAAGRDQRAAREGRSRRHAGGDQGPGDQGNRPDEPDPVGLAGGRRHPDLRRLAGRPAVERLDRRQPRHQGSRPDPRRGPLRPREDQGAHPRVPRGAHPGRHRSAAPSSPSSDLPASARPRSARASRGRWAASSSG